jgi:hypothetical protein
MTISKLKKALDKALEHEAINESTEVLFRHSITEMGERNNSSVNYLLTTQTDRGILLCHDDGNF